MNQFQIASDFYGSVTPLILAQKQNEWAVDPSSWNDILRMTPIEGAIWEHIRNTNAVLYPQYPVDQFFADFANPVAKIAIECDGRDFHQDTAKDAERDRRFHELGWLVYRIPGRLCVTEFDEEEMQEAFAAKFVRAVAEVHGLIRGNPKLSGFDEEMDYCLRYALEGKLGLLGMR